jgi:class 3 adenylate cyclase/CHASE2 domain-containing sensor protein
LVGVLAAAAWPVTQPDLKWLDLQWRAMRAADAGPAEPIVIVGIDEPSLASTPEPLALWHRQLAELLLALGEAKPRQVALDIVLPDRSFAEIAPGLDQALVRALLVTRAAFPTTLAITVDETRNPRKIHPAFVAAAGSRPGLALWPVDGDGRVRRFDERLGENGEAVETLAGQIIRAAGGTPAAGYIDFSYGQAFGYVPFREVLQRRGDAGWLAKTFGGRIVLVGSLLKFEDVVRVPVALSAAGRPAEETPGVMLVAQSVRASLAGRMVQPAPAWAVAAITAIAALLALFAAHALSGGIIAVATLVALAIASHLALRSGTFLPVAWAAAVAIIAPALSHGVVVARNLAERRRLRRSFAGYVSPAVMDEIVRGRIQPDAAGAQRFVCAMFSDIRGYTPRSEKMTPHECIAFLNRYFEGAVAAIHDHGGTVVSFAGDGIMAIFGAPQDLENPCESAFAAARAILANMHAFNGELRKEGAEPIAIGIGLQAGPAVVGHVGSRSRHDYTAIGDAINVASRLEGATKEAGYRVVVSTDVAQRLRDRSALVALGRIAIKGHAPVEAFGFDPVAADAPRNRPPIAATSP